MKVGDLVYPWLDSGDCTVALYLGEEFYDWKGELHGAFFCNKQRYFMPIGQLKLVHVS